MIKVTQKRRLTLNKASAKGRAKFLAAASGLVRVGRFYYVIADDELHLGVFPIVGTAPGSLVRLFKGSLPSKKKSRKAQKPDLEALVELTAKPNTLLLAVPSGSKKNRTRGALIDVTKGPQKTVVGEIDFKPLYRALAKKVSGKLNIEGACVRGDELILAQRGNSKNAHNALITLDLARVRRSIDKKREIDPKALVALQRYTLGNLGGVRLTFTDLFALPDRTIVFSAAAEATDNPVDDAPFTGSVIGRVSARGKLLGSERISQLLKVEGLYAERRANGIHVTFVTDADDPHEPAGLYHGLLRTSLR